MVEVGDCDFSGSFSNVNKQFGRFVLFIYRPSDGNTCKQRSEKNS